MLHRICIFGDLVMESNVTIRLNSGVLRQARHIAVEADLSLSRWVAELIAKATTELAPSEFSKAKKRALARLNKGLNLGGTRYSRDELHER